MIGSAQNKNSYSFHNSVAAFPNRAVYCIIVQTISIIQYIIASSVSICIDTGTSICARI